MLKLTVLVIWTKHFLTFHFNECTAESLPKSLNSVFKENKTTPQELNMLLLDITALSEYRD